LGEFDPGSDERCGVVLNTCKVERNGLVGGILRVANGVRVRVTRVICPALWETWGKTGLYRIGPRPCMWPHMVVLCL